MPAKEPSPLEQAQSAFKLLSASAAELNAASDELTTVVSNLDQALKNLNLGVSAWVTITQGHSDNGFSWSRDIGYAKIGRKWGIALRDICRDEAGDDDGSESWPFSDAPRWLRIEGIAKLPELLDHLVDQSRLTTKRVRKKTDEAKALLDAINAITAAQTMTQEEW